MTKEEEQRLAKLPPMNLEREAAFKAGEARALARLAAEAMDAVEREPSIDLMSVAKSATYRAHTAIVQAWELASFLQRTRSERSAEALLE